MPDERQDQVHDEEGHRGLSRRRLLAAAAWSVPVISVSAAAPAMATSPPPTPGFLAIDASACQYRDTGLALLLHVNNTTTGRATVFVSQLLFNTSQRAVRGVQISISPIDPSLNCLYIFDRTPDPDFSFGVVPGTSSVLLYTKPGTPPSTGGVVTLTYTVPDVGFETPITLQQHVTIGAQGDPATCALDVKGGVNPCAPLEPNP